MDAAGPKEKVYSADLARLREPGITAFDSEWIAGLDFAGILETFSSERLGVIVHTRVCIWEGQPSQGGDWTRCGRLISDVD